MPITAAAAAVKCQFAPNSSFNEANDFKEVVAVWWPLIWTTTTLKVSGKNFGDNHLVY